jgi:hypothetical protein
MLSPPIFSQALSQFGIVNEAPQCRSKSLDITGLDDQSSSLVLNELWKCPHWGTNDGRAVSQRLNHRHPKIFAKGWEHQNIVRAQKCLNLRRTNPTWHRYTIAKSRSLNCGSRIAHRPSPASVALQPDFEPKLANALTSSGTPFLGPSRPKKTMLAACFTMF